MEHIVKTLQNKDLDCFISEFSNSSCKLDSGFDLINFKIAFKTYGKLNDNKNNAILICHALTGDQYVSGKNPLTNRDGWWSRMVGPDKPIDTNKYFVICSNVLGGCSGSSGPKEIDSRSQKPYGRNFPSVTIKDMVKIQNYLIELGAVKSTIKRLRVEENEQDELEESFIAYELFMRCMHPNGIAYEIIKQKLSLINEEIQKCLANIVDFQVMFEEDGRNLDINIKHPK